MAAQEENPQPISTYLFGFFSSMIAARVLRKGRRIVALCDQREPAEHLRLIQPERRCGIGRVRFEVRRPPDMPIFGIDDGRIEMTGDSRASGIKEEGGRIGRIDRPAQTEVIHSDGDGAQHIGAPHTHRVDVDVSVGQCVGDMGHAIVSAPGTT